MLRTLKKFQPKGFMKWKVRVRILISSMVSYQLNWIGNCAMCSLNIRKIKLWSWSLNCTCVDLKKQFFYLIFNFRYYYYFIILFYYFFYFKRKTLKKEETMIFFFLVGNDFFWRGAHVSGERRIFFR